jgi:flagellar biosynthesis protein
MPKPSSQNLKAAALKYDQDRNASPELIAKGQGETANKILSLAKEHQISVFQNKALVDSLLNLEIHEEIPPRLYQAVAELFTWLMKVENRK